MGRGKILRLFTAHICVICSLVFLIVKLLDWYNPYMDFVGQIAAVQYILYTGAFLLGVSQLCTRTRKRK